MRLVDCFLDVILYTRRFTRALPAAAKPFEEVRADLKQLFAEAERRAEQLAYEADVRPGSETGFYPGQEGEEPARRERGGDFNREAFEAAKFGVVAYVDEMLLVSTWEDKGKWQKAPLQREYFDTTNAGKLFYERLNALAKYGPERAVREVYCLCLGLGFRGKYFASDDRQQLEETKSFNLGLLLPEEAQRNLETATLFPSAYGGDRDGRGAYKPRLNLLPFGVVIPTVVVLGAVYLYHRWIVEALDQVERLVR